MVSATHRPEAADLLARIPVTTSSSNKSESSFAQQLASALEGSSAGTGKKATTGPVAYASARQDSGASQNSGAVTPRPASPSATSTASTTSSTTGSTTSTTSSATSTTSSTSTSTTPASDIPTMLGMGPVPGTPPVQESTSSQSDSTPAPEMTEADAYWAEQPAAVQALRNMPDGEAKDQLALQLANEGYSIDTQIMVWGWDPQMTMQIRENQGYAWVPSYGSSNIPVGPGLSVPGESTTYNPASPPPGAIIVSTAFANGTIQNPLVQTNSSSSS